MSMLRFDVVTLFAPMFEAITQHGISARALDRGLWQLRCWNPRDYATDVHRSVDDRPYGGGPGMVMMADPLTAALDAIRADQLSLGHPKARVICLSPQGRAVTHQRIAELTGLESVTLICGRYEAIDQRLIDARVDQEWSIGDFVVSGGELPAMMVIDAAVRLLPGALNDQQSASQDSFAGGLLDFPHYTRPEMFRGVSVPPVLLSGHHARIARWRRDQALAATASRRPDLLAQARRDGHLDADDERFLSTLAAGDPGRLPADC
jgi:tRNA (guanine37-N1)-methyltransferase